MELTAAIKSDTRIDEFLNNNSEIISLLKDEQDVYGYVCITQEQIADRLNYSLSSVSRKLKRLERYNVIKKVRPGIYALL